MSTRNDAETGHWSDWLPDLPAPAARSEEPIDDEHTGPENDSQTRTAPGIERSPSRSKAVRRYAVLAGASLSLAATVAGFACLLWPRFDHQAATRTLPAASPAAVAHRDPVLGGGPGCEAVRSPNMVRGNGIGSLANGPDAILAFEHAYYVLRSGTAARAVTSPDAEVPPAEAIDAGIGTIAPGTTACVVIVPQATGRYQVSITETDPHGAVHSFTQLITTTPSGPEVLITGIHADS